MGQRVLVGLLAFLVLQNILWFVLGGSPQHWDSAIHLTESVHAARLQTNHGTPFFERLLEVSWYYPPFVSYVTALSHRLLGESELAGLLVTTSFLLLFLASAYATATRLQGRPVGLLTVFLLAAAPLVIEHSRVFMLDLPLAALATFAVWLLLVSNGFERLAPSLGLGVVCGLGMLTKWTFPLFVVPPILYHLVTRRSHRLSRSRHAMLALLVAIVLAAPWYTRHTLEILLRRGHVVAGGEATWWQAATYYVRTLPEQLSWPLALLGVFGLLLLIRSRSAHLGFLAVWFWGSDLLISLVDFRQPRFSMTLLVPLAVATSTGLLTWVRDGGRLRGPARRLWIGVWIVPVFVLVSWVPPESRLGRTLGTRFLGSAFLRCTGPDPSDWHNDDIVQALEDDLQDPPRDRVFCRVLPDHAHLNNATLRLQVLLRRAPIEVTGTSNYPMLTDYVVVKTGDPGVDSPSGHRAQLTARALAATDPTHGWLTPIAVYPLPDGSQARLLRATVRPLVGVPAAQMVERVRERGESFVQRYLRPEHGSQFSVEVASDSAAIQGHVERIRVRVERGLLGDFAFGEHGVLATEVDFELRGVRLNPHALVTQNTLEILSVQKLVVSSLRLRAVDLQAYLETTARDWVVDSLTIRAGILRLRARHKDVGPLLSLGVRPALETGRLSFAFTELRIESLPLPVWPLNWWTDSFNPLVGDDPQLPDLAIGTLLLEDDAIRILR